MVKYCMNLSDEKKETAIKIALESKGNVRKRKIAVPLLMILGIVIIFSSIFLIINSPAILWYIYMVLGIVCLLLAFNAKSFQKFVLKKAELLLDLWQESDYVSPVPNFNCTATKIIKTVCFSLHNNYII